MTAFHQKQKYLQFELFWIPPLSSSVKLWKLAGCLLQLIIKEHEKDAILLHAPFQISLFHPVLKFIPTNPNPTANFYYRKLSFIRPFVDHASADLCQIGSFIKSKILYISIASPYSGLW